MSRDEAYAFIETVNEIKSAQREGFRFRDIFHERSPKPPPKVVAQSGLANRMDAHPAQRKTALEIAERIRNHK